MIHTELLRKSEIFAKLSDDELQAVSRCVEERDAEAGAVLIREGVPGDSLFVIREGKVVVEKMVGERKVQLAELDAGCVVGEMSLIDNFPTSATVSAVEDSKFLVISRIDLNVLLNWDTVLAAKMWRSFTEMLCYRVRSSNERLLERFGEDAKDEVVATSHGVESK